MKKEKYGEVIRIARIANDSSVKELAQAVGKSSATIDSLEPVFALIAFAIAVNNCVNVINKHLQSPE